jgi:two-component system phosphate regulon sensor histidine kinase PhoR
LREEKTHKLYGVLALFHDITEMKKTEQIRIEFVQNASHELRTPLTSMKGYIETLKEDLAQKNYEQAESFLKIISKSVDRLTELVSDMLTIANLEGPTLMHKENTNINLLSQEVIERLAPLASEKNIFIHYKSDVDHWFVDAQKVEQVLVNLLSNAIKYIPVNGQVDIFWKQLHGELELHVVDNGPGIAPEHQSRLFERFYRVDKGRARDVGGTGLGLSIVKHIVQAHGGQVGVHSKPGEGSDFYCIFPA